MTITTRATKAQILEAHHQTLQQLHAAKQERAAALVIAAAVAITTLLF